ncbi:relaxase/mobilization nuclease domain-containing protein [Laspinema olomoucense]|uniref:relaxase/mobilization nuclease domain-containing protein n=1 Tax=Laspinema olomoucense TaxID=3231600 RepID=UPI0021BA9C07|nr:relaxase/mobilization nuclease domain-containing protein [Laspinema sp. D3a]MCT7991919.1 relaxase/mobilization nuclease domain-containing protein [Laspinema sp. D3a]
MIGKVTKGNDFTGLLSYVLDKPGAKYIGASQLVGEHEHQWVAQFMRVAAKRRRTEYPVAHYSFSPHPNQPMADETAYRYAQKFCQRMGHENCQWLLVRHTDTKTENGEDRDHFHLVVNRVTIDGARTVSSFNDWYRSQAAHRALIEEFDLHRVPSVWETDRRNPSTGQIRRVRRQNREYAEGARSTPADPIILTELQDRIDKFCQDQPRLPELVRRLRADGVGVRIQPASNGGLAISYQLGSVAAAGSSLGRAYTVLGLQQRRLVSYYPAYDNPVLKLFLKEQWYERASFSQPSDRQEPTANPGSTAPKLSPASSEPTQSDRQENRQNPQSTEGELSATSTDLTQSDRQRNQQNPHSTQLTQSDRQLDAQNHRSTARELSPASSEPASSDRQLDAQNPTSTQPELSPHSASTARSKPDILDSEEYQQWVNQVAPVIDAYLQHRGVPVVQGHRFRTYKRGQYLVLEQQDGSKTLMIAHNADSGSWETRNYFPVERATAQHILEQSLPAMQQEIRPPYAWFNLHDSEPPPSLPEVRNKQEYQQWVNTVAPPFREPPPKPSESPAAKPSPTPSPPDVLSEQEYQQWMNTVAPFLNTYLKHRGGRMVEGDRFRAYKRGEYLVLEYRDGSDTLIIARPSGKGSWETPQQFSVSVKREDANYILERSIPLMQRRMSQDRKRAQNKKRSRSRQIDISD